MQLIAGSSTIDCILLWLRGKPQIVLRSKLQSYLLFAELNCSHLDSDERNAFYNNFGCPQLNMRVPFLSYI